MRVPERCLRLQICDTLRKFYCAHPSQQRIESNSPGQLYLCVDFMAEVLAILSVAGFFVIQFGLKQRFFENVRICFTICLRNFRPQILGKFGYFEKFGYAVSDIFFTVTVFQICAMLFFNACIVISRI